jgi:hypothetical protein
MPAQKKRAQPRAARPQMASVQENIKKFGIYLNAKEKKAVRINSPYWFPPAPEWTFLTPEVNMTLLKIRELSKQKGLVQDADSIQWTSIPPKPEDLARWEAEERQKKAAEASKKA